MSLPNSNFWEARAEWLDQFDRTEKDVVIERGVEGFVDQADERWNIDRPYGEYARFTPLPDYLQTKE